MKTAGGSGRAKELSEDTKKLQREGHEKAKRPPEAQEELSEENELSEE